MYSELNLLLGIMIVQDRFDLVSSLLLKMTIIVLSVL